MGQRKMKRDAEAESHPEVKIVSSVKEALKDLSDFEASSGSSSDEEWSAKKSSKGNRKQKAKSKKKVKKVKSHKHIIFRHDPARNPFLPPVKRQNEEPGFEGFEESEIKKAEKL